MLAGRRQIKLPVEGLIKGLVYAALSTRGWRGYRRTGEVTHVIVKAGIITGDCGGKSRDERADGAQIWAVWRDTLGGEGAAHVADPGGSVCRGVAGDRGAIATGRGAASEDGVGGTEPAPCWSVQRRAAA